MRMRRRRKGSKGSGNGSGVLGEWTLWCAVILVWCVLCFGGTLCNSVFDLLFKLAH